MFVLFALFMFGAFGFFAGAFWMTSRDGEILDRATYVKVASAATMWWLVGYKYVKSLIDQAREALKIEPEVQD